MGLGVKGKKQKRGKLAFGSIWKCNVAIEICDFVRIRRPTKNIRCILVK
jgi:hypothetical protein